MAKRDDPEAIRAWNRASYWKHREKRLAHKSEFNRRNRDLNAEQKRRYRQTGNGRTAGDRASAKWRAANREKVKQANYEWRRRNPERWKVIKKTAEATRRARKKKAQGSASVQQVRDRIAYYGWKCWLCKAEWEAIDHVKPLVKGGSNWPANLRPICNSCNIRRARTRWEFTR